jgi:hypothetical protein
VTDFSPVVESHVALVWALRCVSNFFHSLDLVALSKLLQLKSENYHNNFLSLDTMTSSEREAYLDNLARSLEVRTLLATAQPLGRTLG